MNELTIDDMLTGFIATLASNSIRSVSCENNSIDTTFEKIFPYIQEEAKKENLEMRFTISTHPTYGDSITLQEGIHKAEQQWLIAVANGKLRVLISEKEAPAYLRQIAGSTEFYDMLNNRFLETYHRIQQERSGE